MVMQKIMMLSLSGFIYHVPFKKKKKVYICTCIVYMGMIVMKLLSGTKNNKKTTTKKQNKKTTTKKKQMLYNKNNATYNILINHLFLVFLPKRNAKVLVTS